ncbi:TonB-dependent receptor plug domain-containing protein [Methylocystis sp. H62]|uniref:TonB-dependent receptor plug domain-containing protein n=1 Tax=Methylocystis sp. H62 TaxID=2785789 RepID=UPI0018C1FFEF|nr:TonB-dependent receptor plug domain-containing protein [Methylocystis sp. H62]MBG0794031.1 TonB-dependent receptor plug domain-containing protein [Methylocystis sp. H62]
MSSLKIVFAAAALLMAANGAFADPLIRGVKARRTHTSPPPAQAADNGHYVPYVVGVDGKKYPIMEIPGSVTVIPRQVIDDQQATTLGDALRNVSGVTVRGR